MTENENQKAEHLWSKQEAAEFLGVTPLTLYKYGIPSIRMSPRATRYDPDVVRAWLKERATGGKDAA